MDSHPPASASVTSPARVGASLDAASRSLLRGLRATGAVRETAVADVHALLLRAARFEVARRAPAFPHLRSDELNDVAAEAADDAMMAVLRRLDDFRGESRFTTWVYKFALLEAAATLRKRGWREGEVLLDGDSWNGLKSTALGPVATVEQRELIGALERAIEEALTDHQRRVLVALTIDGVPIDVLAQRLATTRGALYKTLHDARHKLRGELTRQGLSVSAEMRTV